ncbi:chemotaxis protein CheD [Ectothiorhodospiraceae bacterium BW-2]|nr:chemotaxis protein CheD [Ectothiorhodospiraceae bacterium BW-2]
MRIIDEATTKKIVIDPGEYYVCREPSIISTLLGSCVAVCLFDQVERVIGMNHFLLAFNRTCTNPHDLLQDEMGRYGIQAMELLINRMMRMGARKQNLQAKAFGGGQVIQANHFNIGEANIDFAVEFLRFERIPLIASSLGGNYGRMIYFHWSDFSVYMRRIEPQMQQQVASEEQRYLEQAQQQKRQQPSSIHYW